MRRRHLVLAVVGTAMLFTVSATYAQAVRPSSTANASPQLFRLPNVSHRIPGKRYAGNRHAQTRKFDERRVRTTRSGYARLPSVTYIIQPSTRVAAVRSDRSLLDSDHDVLPGYEHLRDIRIESPEAQEPNTDSTKPADDRAAQVVEESADTVLPNAETQKPQSWRPGSTSKPPGTSQTDSKPRDPRSFFDRPGENALVPEPQTDVEPRPETPVPTPTTTKPAPSAGFSKSQETAFTPDTDQLLPSDQLPPTKPESVPSTDQADADTPAAIPVDHPEPAPSTDLLGHVDDRLPGFKHVHSDTGAKASPEASATDSDSLLLPADKLLPAPTSEPLSPSDDLLVAPPTTYREGFDQLLPPAKSDSEPIDQHLDLGGYGDAENDEDDEGEEAKDDPGVDPHLELLSKNMYPSAKECGKCHEDHYREWSVSAHAYASISPMFQKFEQTINDLSKGTIGYFCMRCHAPVATSICETRDKSLWESIPAANEGVTCIACHRVIERYFKVNGERRIETGSIFEPVVGASNQNKLHEIIAKKDHYKVKTSPDEKGPGQAIHNDVVCFEQLSSSHFCVSCHQVAVHPGIKLEIVWDQYRASPACKQGISCQDCHMGAVPGKAEGYETGPTAVVGGKEIHPHRKHSNHMFFGPGYSIAHPGTFPINKKAEDWSVKEWLDFDWRAGWGTEEFEDMLDEGKIDVKFPKQWEEVDDRMDARDIINENMQLLAEKKQSRFELMEHSSKVEGPYFAHAPKAGKALKFKYRVKNLNSGHNMPSGSLGAQPQVWLNVVLTGPHGNRVWESGYVDANGDVADVHSLEVAAGRIPRDLQLFNLQTKFLTTGVKGTDREMYLPINVDIDQLPFIRPSGLPITNLNHPPFIRLENHSLAPLGERDAKYRVPAKCMETPGRYRLSVRMRSRAEPIYFMRFCKATPEMERGMNERMLDFHQHAYEFVVR